MDAAEHQRAALVQRRQRERYKRPDRRKDDGGIERLRRLFVRRRPPIGPELARELLRRRIARAREGVDLLAMEYRELGNDMRRGAEAIDAEAARRRAPASRRDSR